MLEQIKIIMSHTQMNTILIHTWQSTKWSKWEVTQNFTEPMNFHQPELRLGWTSLMKNFKQSKFLIRLTVCFEKERKRCSVVTDIVAMETERSPIFIHLVCLPPARFKQNCHFEAHLHFHLARALANLIVYPSMLFQLRKTQHFTFSWLSWLSSFTGCNN